jgi:hypothetical protein
MRQFQISAIVDERILWELMNLLEQSKAHGILARPYSNGADQPIKEVREVREVTTRGSGQGLPLKLNGVPANTVAREAILAAVAERETVTVKEIIASTGLNRMSVYRAFHAMKKERFVKSTGVGQYTKGRKEAPVS